MVVPSSSDHPEVTTPKGHLNLLSETKAETCGKVAGALLINSLTDRLTMQSKGARQKKLFIRMSFVM